MPELELSQTPFHLHNTPIPPAIRFMSPRSSSFSTADNPQLTTKTLTLEISPQLRFTLSRLLLYNNNQNPFRVILSPRVIIDGSATTRARDLHPRSEIVEQSVISIQYRDCGYLIIYKKRTPME